MYLGIDLGTSNSAIVGNVKSELRLFKTADGTDVLPSVISINKLGHRFVGNRAYQQALLSPENVAQGFKRLMGTNSPITFAASGVTMSPEECSAEIIRTLLSQVKTESGDTQIEGAVVTIPAAFNQMQSEATLRAAEAAGIDRVGLLQEPIAAAMASISQSRNKNGQFLVYDLGGGTFDVALVQSINGSVNIVAHEGINMLGGRDFDRAIVNSIVRPWLLSHFDLPENFQADSRFQRLIGVARFAAERAKIELSASEKAVIFAGDEEVRVKDGGENDIYLSIDMTRADLEGLIQGQLADSITLCRKVIKDNGYSHEDIDRIVLIGGPSKMPGIRARVPQELGIPADLQTDPMTAVAIGAAIFAESRQWGEGVTKRKASRGSSTVKGKVEIRYDYPARTSEDRARIRVRPAGDTQGFRLQIDAKDGWSSGIVPITPDLTIEVPLPSRGDNPCRVTVYDASQAPVHESSTILTIVRTHASAAGIPATQTLSVKVVEKVGSGERNVLEPLVTKGTPLPAEGTKRFKAATDVRGGEPTELAIELFQQAEGVPEPELNLFVGSFVINGQSHLERSETLRKGDEIIIKWSMDDNGILNCSIDIPPLSKTFDTGKFYVSAAGHRNFEGEDGAALTDAVIKAAESELLSTQEVVGENGRAALEELRERMLRQRDALTQSADADARRSVTEQARAVRQQLSRLRNAPENRGMLLERELTDSVESFDAVLRENVDPRIAEIFDRQAGTAKLALRGNRLDDAERAIHEMRAMAQREVWSLPSFLVYMFKEFASDRHLATDKALHDRLVKQGEVAVKANDIDTLRHVMAQLASNTFSIGAATSKVAALAGLMRG